MRCTCTAMHRCSACITWDRQNQRAGQHRVKRSMVPNGGWGWRQDAGQSRRKPRLTDTEVLTLMLAWCVRHRRLPKTTDWRPWVAVEDRPPVSLGRIYEGWESMHAFREICRQNDPGPSPRSGKRGEGPGIGK